MAISREFVIKANNQQLPYTTLLALAAGGFSIEKTIQLADKLQLVLDGEKIENDVIIARIIAQSSKKNEELLGKNIHEFAKIDQLLNLCQDIAVNAKEERLNDIQLAPSGLAAADRLTLADYAIFSFVHNHSQLKSKFAAIIDKVVNDGSLAAAHSQVGIYKTKTANKPQNNAAKEKKKDEGMFVELPGAEKGKVVVRFPPEASGYLHIGHAKAALLNQYYQQAFEGQLIMRFDDTNPAKENAHFEQVIKEDLKLLNIVPDRWTHSSDHFELIMSMCEKLLKEGKAYVDDTDTETMRKEREERVESKNRNNDPAKNFALWEEMKAGTPKGLTCCVRIKMDMKSNNGAMRDPTIYRCKPEEHVRTGNKYKVYPTYDFTCPIVDSIEGVTHALRTTEYHDRDDQYYFICDALGLRRPYIWEYARLNMTNTVMSKRKLTWFVDEGHVEGWDDPRLPTVRGVMRRGLTVEGLKQFIVAQGGSRSVVMMEWDKIWAFNKKVIDPIAPRYTALDTSAPLVTVNLSDNITDEVTNVALHPKNADVGSKEIHRGKKILLEQIDAAALKEGETVTFVNWGNIKINNIAKKGSLISSIDASLELDNKDYKKTTKVTWLGDVKAKDGASIAVVTADYDHIISKAVIGKDEDWKNFINYDSVKYTKMIGEPAMRNLKKGDIIQLQRKGFYIVDQVYNPKSELSGVETPLLLIAVPDGHTSKEAAPTPSSSGVPAKTSAGEGAFEAYKAIEKQGDVVRDLKAKDAKSQATKDAIAKLLELKKQYKELTGAEYKPGQPPITTAAAPVPSTSTGSGLEIYNEIEAQGNLVRELKSKDAKSQAAKDAIAKLLELKKKYKEVTGADHKPGNPPAAAAATTVPAAELYAQVEAQGLLVRDLKSKDAKSQATKDAIAKLLDLKKQYKDATGTEYKPGNAPGAAPQVTSTDIASAIDAQGNLVRELKSKDAKSQTTKDAIAKLLELKKQFKEATGHDYKPCGSSKVFRTIRVQEGTSCYRLLNGTHQFGCHANDENRNGILVEFDNLENVRNCYKPKFPSYNGKFWIMIETTKLNRETMEVVKASNCTSGLVLITSSTEFSISDNVRGSHDSNCPNEMSNVYFRDEKQPYCQNEYNEAGAILPMGLRDVNWGIQMVYVRNQTDINIMKKCHAMFNSNQNEAEYPYCGMSFKLFNSAAGSSKVCHRRGQPSSKLFEMDIDTNGPSELCSPLSGQNLFGWPTPLNNSAILTTKPKYMAISARLDSFGVIPEVSPGELSVLTSIISVIVAARTISDSLTKWSDASYLSNRHIMFSLFNGEAFDYIGSSAAVNRMRHGVFPLPVLNISQLRNIDLEQIDYVVEFQQIGTREGHKMYLHYDSDRVTADNKRIFEKIEDSMEKNGLRLDEVTRVPPASWHSFAKFNSKVQAIVLAPFEGHYNYGRVNSMLDVNKWDEASKLRAINDISASVSAVLAGAAEFVGLTPDDKVTKVDKTLVSTLFNCLVDSKFWFDCDFMKKLNGGRFYPYMDAYTMSEKSTYISVSSQNPFRLIVHWLLIFALGSDSDTLNVKDKNSCRHLSEHQAIYAYDWQPNPYTGNFSCWRSSIQNIVEHSPAFDIDDYDFSNSTYSTWTESVYSIEDIKLFLIEDNSFDWICLLAAILALIIAIFSIGRCAESTFIFDEGEPMAEIVMVEGEKSLKSERKKCYEARDYYEKCIDKYLDEGKSEKEAISYCKKERKKFDSDCPASWVSHFIRKHQFERYKQELTQKGVNIADKNALSE
ncbi:unnamed protein product [Caenorhabditis bovis]|uniref:glutamate--tRNA ligase n=1 Tax=Caenorhabditis bovis TaxID=2654633 RepID=A0A8S1FDX8_9PELO|nr:unnamed protein product [Caenorhabditis bovis]